MKKKGLMLFMLMILLLIMASPVLAAGGYPWTNHTAPYSFLFGNEIDTHQQSLQTGADRISGFLYIHYTGETIDGIPVAEHMDCATMPDACIAGWSFRGIKIEARLLQPDMLPTWCVEGSDLSRWSGYSHFHWLGQPEMGMDLVAGQIYEGYLMKMIALETFYFRHHDTLTLVTPGLDVSSHANILSCSSG